MEANKPKEHGPAYNTQPAGVEKALVNFYSKTIQLNLPKGGQKWLADNAWWLVLLGGVLSLLGAWNFWQLGHAANQYIELANQIARSYGAATTNDLGFTWYLALAAMVAQGVLMLLAFNPLKQHKKAGWNLVFYSTFITVVMGVLYVLTPGYGVASLLGTAIGLLIGWFFLFQVRSHFTK